MAGSTVAITFRFKGNTQDITALSSEFDKLRGAINAGIDPAQRLRTNLINFNQVQETFNNVASSVQGLSAVINDLSGAYAIQEQAETKLETVMRQRMGATEDMIQGIKNLCSAQQELGVIGDEVQLAGAQQLATFLRQESALRVLIPAMNDLAAQQKGLNATSGDLVGIANLMGKALQGQTSALRRVGISFDEAQENAIKYGSEMQRAAALAEVITANVGHMNAELAKTDAGKAQQLANTIGDIKEQMGQAVAGVAPFVTIGTQIITATANFGKFITTIRSAGVAAMAFSRNMLTVSSSFVMGSATAMTFGVALRGLLLATGIGVAIWALSAAITALIGSMEGAADKTETLEQALKRERQSVAGSITRYNQHIDQLKNFSGSKEEEKRLVDELNNTYGQTMGYFSTISGWYKALTANSKAYTQQLFNEARARAYADKITELEKQKMEHEATRTGIARNADGTARKYSTRKGVEHGTGVNAGEIYSTKSDHEEATDRYNAETEAIRQLNREQEALKKQMNASQVPVKFAVTGSAAPPVSSTPSPVRSGGSRSSSSKEEQTRKRKLQKLITAELTKAEAELTEAEIAESRKRISSWQGEIDALERRERAMKLAADPQTLGELDEAISYQNDLLRNASKDEVAAIRETIRELEEKKKAFEEVRVPVIEQIRTIAQLEEAERYYNEAFREADADTREGLKEQLKLLRQLREAWEAETDAERKAREEKEKAERLASRIAELSGLSVPGYDGTSALSGMGTDELKRTAEEVTSIYSGMYGEITEQQRTALGEMLTELQRYTAENLRSRESITEAWGAAKGMVSNVESMTTAIKEHKNVWQVMSSAVDSALGIWEGMSKILDMTKAMDAATKALGATKQTAAAIDAATTAEAVANSSEKTTANIEEAASGTLAANAKIPLVGIALGIAAVGSILAIMQSLPKFAKGGIAYGPTLGLFGEYAGASNNPEVVAPLDRLKELIEPQGGGLPQTVRLYASGADLAAVIDTRRRKVSRT